MTTCAQLTAPGQLQHLGPLIVGMKTETFLNLTSDKLLSSLPAMAQHTPGLSPPQANAVATKLWVRDKHSWGGTMNESNDKHHEKHIQSAFNRPLRRWLHLVYCVIF